MRKCEKATVRASCRLVEPAPFRWSFHASGPLLFRILNFEQENIGILSGVQKLFGPPKALTIPRRYFKPDYVRTEPVRPLAVFFMRHCLVRMSACMYAHSLAYCMRPS